MIQRRCRNMIQNDNLSSPCVLRSIAKITSRRFLSWSQFNDTRARELSGRLSDCFLCNLFSPLTDSICNCCRTGTNESSLRIGSTLDQNQYQHLILYHHLQIRKSVIQSKAINRGTKNMTHPKASSKYPTPLRPCFIAVCTAALASSAIPAGPHVSIATRPPALPADPTSPMKPSTFSRIAGLP